MVRWVNNAMAFAMFFASLRLCVFAVKLRWFSVVYRPRLPEVLDAVCLVSHRATNCCQLIFDEAFHTSRKKGLDRLAACISPGVSGRAPAL